MLKSSIRLLPFLLVAVMGIGMTGCAVVNPGSGQSIERFMEDDLPRYRYRHRFTLDLYRGMLRGPGYLTLVNLNPACDGMALRFFIRPGSRKQPTVNYEVIDEHDRMIGRGRTNRIGEMFVDFEGNDFVTIVIDEGLMWSMRTARRGGRALARPQVEAGTYDHGRVLMRYGTVRLGQLLETGKQVIEFRGSQEFCTS